MRGLLGGMLFRAIGLGPTSPFPPPPRFAIRCVLNLKDLVVREGSVNLCLFLFFKFFF